MVNIIIQKVGGILESEHINSLAKGAGMEVMEDCLNESWHCARSTFCAKLTKY